MSTGPAMAAPDRLEPVRRFLNTLDVEAGTDAITDPAGLATWLTESGLWRGDAPVTDDDLRRARELREALRAAAVANHDRAALPPPVLAVLDAAAERAGVRISFTPDRGWRATAGATGADGATGELVLRVTESMADGTWPRLKICASDACRWAFYDSSRSGTGKWCSMQLCGNRAKQEAWRGRRREAG
ncbi:CGNR zinc finger domain-containing protein [Micromonospora sp. WMMC241]|uniref:CGNR zinc finger domain-containing protein n=1 Tax=Micromonospora sp. WMMC241 TaxID=3015159 RepID=UPI0022B6680E|nr:CGNR zinc finger domain-containing protein [Micromonospora sp. WMMC241]MCZ7434877.1 CGNR zinc finger domain-containing protein [Micromonospora sp. WMMC241]